MQKITSREESECHTARNSAENCHNFLNGGGVCGYQDDNHGSPLNLIVQKLC